MPDITALEFQKALKAANRGDVSEQVKVGDCYRDGTGIEQNSSKAFEWYMKAAQNGYALGQNKVAYCYRVGFGIDEDENEVYRWYAKAAEQGDAYGQCGVGDCFLLGIGVEKNESECFKWYLKSAEQGLDIAQGCVGGCFYSGLGVEQDKEKCFKWYMKAAEQGLSACQATVGAFYINGEGVRKDATLGFEWSQKSADQGDAFGQRNVGHCYSLGIGVDKDKTKAFEWFLKAAKQEDAYSQYKVGECYFNGIGVKEDSVKAHEWYLKSAKNGNDSGQYELGVCLFTGKGVARDEKNAAKWFIKSSEQGNADAQIFSGLCYQYGIGVEKDGKKAFSWYMKAAEQNDPIGQIRVANCYKDGIGVIRNPRKAFEWFEKCSEQGIGIGYVGLGFCFRDGIGIEKDERKAFELFKKSADLGEDVGYYALGDCYGFGMGVEVDKTKAFECYLKVAEDGDFIGQSTIGAFYHLGFGVSQDNEKAFEWLLKSIDFSINPYFSVSLWHICEIGHISNDWRMRVEVVLRDIESRNIDVELFCQFLHSDYENSDDCQKILALCLKHKQDYGGFASFLLSLFFEESDDSSFSNLSNRNNALSYYYLRNAAECGWPVINKEYEKYYRDTHSVIDYNLIDGKIAYDKAKPILDEGNDTSIREWDMGIDSYNIGKALESVSKKLIKGFSSKSIIDPVVGIDSIYGFVANRFFSPKWDIESKPNFTIKIRTDVKKEGGIYDDKKSYQSLYKRDKDVNRVINHMQKLGIDDSENISNSELWDLIDNTCPNLGRKAKERVFNTIRYGVITFGDVEDEDGNKVDFMDSQEDKSESNKDVIRNNSLVFGVEKAVAILDHHPFVRKWVKKDPAPGTCILACLLYEGMSDALIEDDIISILGKTENFTYDLHPLFKLFKERKGNTLDDKEICKLIGVLPSSYSRTKETLTRYIQESFLQVFSEEEKNYS